MNVSWQNPGLSLGERTVLFCENELKNNVQEDKPGSYTSPRIVEYFSICTRIINGKEYPIGKSFKASNWCSAAASFALHESLLPGETPPHGYRLGVVEIIADMQKLGAYRDLKDVKSGEFKIQVGDNVFFDRSRPNEPDTAWMRHIGKVLEVGSSGKFTVISGNSYGKWRVTNHDFNQPKLLGFGEYPTTTTVIKPTTPISWKDVDLDKLNPMEDTGRDLEVDKVWDLFDNIK